MTYTEAPGRQSIDGLRLLEADGVQGALNFVLKGRHRERE